MANTKKGLTGYEKEPRKEEMNVIVDSNGDEVQDDNG